MLVCLQAAATPDYTLLDEVLLANVRNGYVDYDGIAADPRFAKFVGQLGEAPGDLSAPGAALAYDINAYNAFAIDGVLKGNSPVTKRKRARFFTGVEFKLGGTELTLDQLATTRVHAAGDARSHFALACGSISCPRLWNRAYRPENLDKQLDDAARRFVNDSTRNRYDIAQRTAFVAPLFTEHQADFEKAAGTLPAYLARYVSEPASRAALREGRLAIKPLAHEWDLNGRYDGEARN